MKFPAVALLLALVAVGVFGFAGMSHDMSHGSGCIASVLNNSAVCPDNSLASALYHTSAYKSFTEATLGATALTVITALFLLIVAALARAQTLMPIPIPVTYGTRVSADEKNPLQTKLIHWLSLFENSPSSFRSA